MNVELGSGGLAGELSQSLDELLLQVVVDLILLAEEDNTALGDLDKVSGPCNNLAR